MARGHKIRSRPNISDFWLAISYIAYNSKTTPPRVKILPPVDFLGSNYPNKKFSSRNSKFSNFDTLAFFSTNINFLGPDHMFLYRGKKAMSNYPFLHLFSDLCELLKELKRFDFCSTSAESSHSIKLIWNIFNLKNSSIKLDLWILRMKIETKIDKYRLY